MIDASVVAVAVEDREPEAVAESLDERRWHTAAAGREQAQAAEIDVVEVGVAQHQLPLRRNALGDGDPLVTEELQGAARRPRLRRDDRGDDVADLVPRPGHGA